MVKKCSYILYFFGLQINPIKHAHYLIKLAHKDGQDIIIDKDRIILTHFQGY